MTYDSNNADRDDRGDRPYFQSAGSAQDGDVADSLAIDSAINQDDAATPGLSPAPSTAPFLQPPGPRHAMGPGARPPTRRRDAAADETALIPRLSAGPSVPDPSVPGQSVPGPPVPGPPVPGPSGPPTPGPPTPGPPVPGPPVPGPPVPGPPVPGPPGPGGSGPTGPPSGPARTEGTDPAGDRPGGAGPKRGRRRKGKTRRKAPWWELPLLVAVAIVIAVLVKSFVIQPFYIPSESMEKTLHGCPGCKGDRILVNKPIYDLRDPHPGDIAVFHAPPGWDDEPPSVPPSNPVVRAIRGFGQLVGFVPPDGLVLVKRVIAVGGQTVKGVSLNGHDEIMISTHGAAGPWRTLDEPYTYYSGDDSHAEFGPVTVPKGRLWVMGDHRNDSADSRFHCGNDGTQGADGASCDPKASTVPINEVIGKAVVIAWPPSRWRSLGTPATFKKAAQALGGELPVASGAAFVLPFYFVRRRRRRRRT